MGWKPFLFYLIKSLVSCFVEKLQKVNQKIGTSDNCIWRHGMVYLRQEGQTVAQKRIIWKRRGGNMKKRKKIVSWILALAVVFTQIFCIGGMQAGKITAEAAQNYSTFTLYYYSESSDPLYVNIWNWAGIEFSENASTNSDWGWDHPQAVMQAVDQNANWYSTEITIKASANDGFDIYQGGSADSNKVATYDDQWNSTSDYATLVSGGYSAYAVKNDTLYTDLSAAGLNISSSAEEGYKITITPSADSVETGKQITLTAKVTNDGTEITNLEEAGLHLFWWDNTNNSDSWFVEYDGTNGHSLTLNINPDKVGTFEIQAKLQNSSWEDLALQTYNIKVTEPSTAVQGELNVTKVENLSQDFIMGMDISSVITLFDSGVTFKDWNGNTINNVNSFCEFLASNGITHIRVRVWNNPYDANGHGYGGGNNDVAKAKQIADACEAAGMHMLVDFHCSDLWTDPSKQQAPKAWKDYTLDQKKDALKAFITDSLNTIDPNKNTVDMVQVGNETTGGFIGEKDIANMCTLFSAGSEGVKAFNSSTKVVIHVESPHKGSVTTWAKNLSEKNVSYDIIATSYYPYWHGTLANLKSEFQKVKETYGKDVMVAETSYAYTLEDSDGHENTVRKGNNDTGDNIKDPFTEQGQATFIRNLINTVNEAGGLGVFYWEPAWLTVGDTRGLTGTALESQIAANKQKWETYGSGWAASYAAEYDAVDAGRWFGGSAVDNQAMFYPDGTPTAGLRVWKYVKTGAVSNAVTVDDISNPAETVEQDGSYTLPNTVSVTYNTGKADESVTWASSAAEKIDTGNICTYIVSGKVNFSKTITSGEYKGKTSAPVTYTLNVKPKNLIPDKEAAGFESADAAAKYTVVAADNSYNLKDGKPVKIIDNLRSTDIPSAGTYCVHWTNYKNPDAAEGSLTYKDVISLPAGSYIFEAKAQGAEGEIVTLQILDADDQVLYAGSGVTLEGWANWKTPVVSFTLTETTDVKVRMVINMKSGGWGSADELYLHSPAEENVVYINDTSSSGSSSGSAGSTGSTGESGTDTTTIIKNPDGTTESVTNISSVNSSGKKTEITTSVLYDKDGTVISTEEVTVIENPAKNTSASVTVKKDADGNIKEASADVTRTGTIAAKGTKVTVSAAVAAQIKEAAGTDSVMITTTVTDSRGKKKYAVTVSSGDLSAGEKLEIFTVDKKTGEYIVTSEKNCKVSEKGNATVTLPDGEDYILLNSKDAKKVSDRILKTVKVKNSSKTVTAGKKTSIQLSSKLNMDNVKKITYTTSNSKKATVDKNGKITAKKPGTVIIKAKVTLNNGKTKTVTMKLKIKKPGK